MALFTAIGTALGATAGTAFATGLGATAIAGSVGYSIYSGAQASADAKKAEGQMAQMPTAPAPVAPKQEDAAQAAAAITENKKRAIAANESVFTNPLGLKDEADVARKKLLGG
jgi:hypothetical protein